MATCPETLLLDLQRLQYLQAEFAYHVLFVSALTKLSTQICSLQIRKLFPMEERQRHLMDVIQGFLSTYIPCSSNMEDVINELKVELSVHNVEYANLVCAIVQESRRPCDAVYTLFLSRILAAWQHVVCSGCLPSDPQLPDCAKGCLPRITSAALKLRSVILWNLRVHAHTYTCFIQATVSSMPQAVAISQLDGGGTQSDGEPAITGKKRDRETKGEAREFSEGHGGGGGGGAGAEGGKPVSN